MKELFTTKGLLVGVVLFFALHMITSLGLRGARVDLTEGSLYTLTDGSRNILQNLDEPITLKFFYSQSLLGAEFPILKTYGQRVRELLEEFAAESDGSLLLQVIEPEPFSDAEDEAVQSGMRGLPVTSAGDMGYFGLVAENSTDQRAVIPFFDPGNEKFLEYDLARLVYRLGNPEKQVVGVMSFLPVMGGPPSPFPGAPPPPPGWFVFDQVRETFDVQPVAMDVDTIPPEIDVLVVAYPKGISERTLYAIDQFVLGGGKALVTVDPFCEEDAPPRDPNNPLAGMEYPRSADAGPLFEAWGVSLVPDTVAADRGSALAVTGSGSGGRMERVDYIVWLGLERERFDADDPITADLGVMNIAAPGILRPVEGASTTITPLIQTSEATMEIETSRLQFMPDPKGLLNEFEPSGVPAMIAARILGPAKSAFPDGQPAAEPVEGEEADDAAAPAHLADSAEIHVIVVADSDFMADRWWVSFRNLLGMQIPAVNADNGSFTINALDSLAGSTDLVGVRSRGSFQRRFHVIDDLQDQAEQRYLAEEQTLQEELTATNRRLTELQSERADGASVIMTPEQAEEIETFRQMQVDTRKKLRAVKHELSKDIEGLQSWLKFLNIFGVPLLVLIAALIRWKMK